MGRDAGVMLAMRIAGTVLWLLYTIMLARSLTPADFTTALYVINFSLLAILLITCGRDVALLRFASKAWADGARGAVREMLRRSRMVLLLNGSVLTIGLLGLSWVGLDTPVTKDPSLAALAGLLTLAGAQMGLNRDCLRAVGRVWQSQLGLNFTRSVVPLLGAAGVWLMGRTISAEGALLLFLCSLVLSIAVEERFLRQIAWQDDPAAGRTDLNDVWRAGWALWPGDVANALMMRSVGLVGALVLMPQAAALLLAAERIAGLAQFPIAAAAQAAAPRIAQATNSGDAAVQQALDRGSVLMALGALLGCLGAAALAWPALWAFGPEYVAAFPTTLMLIVGSLGWAFFGLGQSALNLTGRSRHYSLISICATCLTVTGLWFAATHHGAFGVAVAWCIGWWMTNIAYTITLARVCGLNTGIVSLGRQGLARLRARR